MHLVQKGCTTARQREKSRKKSDCSCQREKGLAHGHSDKPRLQIHFRKGLKVRKGSTFCVKTAGLVLAVHNLKEREKTI